LASRTAVRESAQAWLQRVIAWPCCGVAPRGLAGPPGGAQKARRQPAGYRLCRSAARGLVPAGCPFNVAPATASAAAALCPGRLPAAGDRDLGAQRCMRIGTCAGTPGAPAHRRWGCGAEGPAKGPDHPRRSPSPRGLTGYEHRDRTISSRASVPAASKRVHAMTLRVASRVSSGPTFG
jgi:hypothetical protein